MHVHGRPEGATKVTLAPTDVNLTSLHVFSSVKR